MHSRHAFSTFALVLVSLVPVAFAGQGCTDDKEPVAAGTTAPTPTGTTTTENPDVPEKVAATITFGADPNGAPTLEGTLAPGARVEVKYDAGRLANCRSTAGGNPTWTITGNAQGNADAAATTFPVAGNGAPARTLFTAGQGYDLALWFENTDSSGCRANDAKLGENYHFALGEPPKSDGAVVTFSADPKVPPTVTGRLVKGVGLTVKYDTERLKDCRNAVARNPIWAIHGNAQINAASPVRFFVAGAAPSPTEDPEDPVVALTEAGTIALWFENTSNGGCQASDANQGQNYKLTIDER